MITLILLTGVLLALVGVGVWPVLRDLRKDRGRRPAVPESGAAETPRPHPVPASLEGSLVSGLLEHELSAAQYRHAMERLALRDDDRFPLRTPPEAGSRDQGLW